MKGKREDSETMLNEREVNQLSDVEIKETVPLNLTGILPQKFTP